MTTRTIKTFNDLCIGDLFRINSDQYLDKNGHMVSDIPLYLRIPDMSLGGIMVNAIKMIPEIDGIDNEYNPGLQTFEYIEYDKKIDYYLKANYS